MPVVCEADHSARAFFGKDRREPARAGNGLPAAGLGLVEAADREHAMGQRITHQPSEACRSGHDGEVWLSSLIDTMEVVAREDIRDLPCDDRLLSAVRQQLAQPASSDHDLRPELIQSQLPADFSLRT